MKEKIMAEPIGQSAQQAPQKGFNKTEWSWMVYDLTTNAYATIILTTIFPIYFNTVLGHNTLGLEFKGYATSFIMIVATIASPILGVFADVQGMKKRLWAVFAFVGAFLTFGMVFANSWQLLLLGYVLSNIAYNTAFLFYDSFITDVTTPERMHKVSTWGFSVGYFFGGTVVLVASAAMVFTMKSNPALAVKLSFALTALWWAIFSLPMLFNVKQIHYNTQPIRTVTRNLLTSLKGTFLHIWHDRGLRFFMLAYFFYIDGVGTVITMATSYGNVLGLSSTSMIAAILLTQIVAIPFTILFGRLAKKLTAIRMIKVAILVYIVICLLGFYMGYSIETAAAAGRAAALANAQILFWLMAGLVGTAQGGIQALSRSQFGRMVPAEQSNEYFGFFNIFNRFASIVGPLLMALITAWTRKASFGILAVVILFVAGLYLLHQGRENYRH